jgi:hypothetical protein
MEHPVIRSLGEAANDLVTWSNVYTIFVVCPVEPHYLITGLIFLQRRAIQRRYAQHDSRRHE